MTPGGGSGMRHVLEARDFQLELEFEVLDADLTLPLPVNALLNVWVTSEGFSAATYMDVEAGAFAAFCSDLHRLCRELRGTANIHEVFAHENYIEFTGDGDGLIGVTGMLSNHWRDGMEQSLKFENHFDQMCLCKFAHELYSAYWQYMRGD